MLADTNRQISIGLVQDTVVFWTLLEWSLRDGRIVLQMLAYPLSFQCSGCVNESTYRIRSRIDR